jgi:hypothetical protein
MVDLMLRLDVGWLRKLVGVTVLVLVRIICVVMLL